MKIVLGLLAIALFLAAVGGGLYVAIWLCLVGGIVDILEQIKAESIDSMVVAGGIAKIFLTSVAGWATFFFGAIIAGFVGAIASEVN